MKQININKSISRKTNILSILPCIFNSFQNTDYSFLCIAFKGVLKSKRGFGKMRRK